VIRAMLAVFMQNLHWNGFRQMVRIA
jgi:hypothetical protein